MAALRMRSATPGSKKRARSRAAAPSLTERTSRLRAREMATASTAVVSRMASTLSASAWIRKAFEVRCSTKSVVGLGGPPRPPSAYRTSAIHPAAATTPAKITKRASKRSARSAMNTKT